MSVKYHVVAYDFGVKRNILRMLVDRGCRLTVVPAKTPAAEVLAMKPDGIFLSNGPGDPEPCDYAIEAIKRNSSIPTPRCSASASATSCWAWLPAPRPSR
jgi:carbamoyl-phosphate synthase small subunit